MSKALQWVIGVCVVLFTSMVVFSAIWPYVTPTSSGADMMSGTGQMPGAGMMNPASRAGMMNGGGMMGNGMGMMGNAADSYPTAQPTPIGATPAPVDEEIQLTAQNLKFSPAEVTVKPGETVRFTITNTDSFAHNVVSAKGGLPYLLLPSGATQTLVWTAPQAAGTYTALCTFHPGMTLVIRLQN